MRCALCGKTFELEQCSPGCTSCPLHSSCGGVRCPYCGYNNVREAGLIRFLRSIFEKDSSATASAQEQK